MERGLGYGETPKIWRPRNGILMCFREMIMGKERADCMCPGHWDFPTSREKQEESSGHRLGESNGHD